MQESLLQIYQEFEDKIAPYRAQAVCRLGCAYCCINVGTVDATTLEGMLIRSHLRGWQPKARAEIDRKLKRNRQEKLQRVFARCAFLDDELSCTIYPVRPFSCRRLYSVKRCGEHGPVIHRAALDFVKDTVKALQELDCHGCSGHLSFILHLLQMKDFRRAYCKGALQFERFKNYLVRYQVVPHRSELRTKYGRNRTFGIMSD